MREKHFTKGLSNNEEAGGTMLSWLLTGWELQQQQEKGRACGTGLNFLRSWLQLPCSKALPVAALSWANINKKSKRQPQEYQQILVVSGGEGRACIQQSVLCPKVRQTLPVPAELGHHYECAAVCNGELARLRQHKLQTEKTLVWF